MNQLSCNDEVMERFKDLIQRRKIDRVKELA